tara:strand:- start:40 stop:429 length:390 start_codon:yes stop_codon:yes gene_type:complete
MPVEVKSITESIYSAISEAQRAVEESQAHKLLTNYFNEDGTPKTIPLNLNGNKIDAPLLTLANHSQLKISECEVELEVNIDHDGKKAMGCLGKLRKSKMAKLKLKFTSTDKPEGVSRLEDNQNKIITTI